MEKIDTVKQNAYFMFSERIGFSHWTKNDLPMAISLWGDMDVTKYISASGIFTKKEIEDRLKKEIQNEKEYGVQYWPVFLLANNEFIGVCGLRPRAGSKEYEIGFHLKKSYWHQGLAGEAAKRVMEYAFESLGAKSLFAGHNPENVRSKRVLEKLGFVNFGEEYYKPTGLMHPSYIMKKEVYLMALNNQKI